MIYRLFNNCIKLIDIRLVALEIERGLKLSLHHPQEKLPSKTPALELNIVNRPRNGYETYCSNSLRKNIFQYLIVNLHKMLC